MYTYVPSMDSLKTLLRRITSFSKAQVPLVSHLVNGMLVLLTNNNQINVSRCLSMLALLRNNGNVGLLFYILYG